MYGQYVWTCLEYVEVVEYYMEYVVCLPPIVQTNKGNKPTTCSQITPLPLITYPGVVSAVVKPSSVKLMAVDVISRAS